MDLLTPELYYYKVIDCYCFTDRGRSVIVGGHNHIILRFTNRENNQFQKKLNETESAYAVPVLRGVGSMPKRALKFGWENGKADCQSRVL